MSGTTPYEARRQEDSNWSEVVRSDNGGTQIVLRYLPEILSRQIAEALNEAYAAGLATTQSP